MIDGHRLKDKQPCREPTVKLVVDEGGGGGGGSGGGGGGGGGETASPTTAKDVAACSSLPSGDAIEANADLGPEPPGMCCYDTEAVGRHGP